MRRVSNVLLAIAAGVAVPDEQIERAVGDDFDEAVHGAPPRGKRVHSKDVAKQRAKNKAARAARRKGRR